MLCPEPIMSSLGNNEASWEVSMAAAQCPWFVLLCHVYIRGIPYGGYSVSGFFGATFKVIVSSIYFPVRGSTLMDA